MSGFFEAPRRSVSRRSTAPKVRRRAAARGVRADSTAAPRSRRRRALSRRPPRDRGVAAGSGSRRSASAASSASRRSTAASRSAPTCSRAPRRLRAMRPAPPISFLACFRAGHFSQRRARPAAFSGRAPARAASCDGFASSPRTTSGDGLVSRGELHESAARGLRSVPPRSSPRPTMTFARGVEPFAPSQTFVSITPEDTRCIGLGQFESSWRPCSGWPRSPWFPPRSPAPTRGCRSCSRVRPRRRERPAARPALLAPRPPAFRSTSRFEHATRRGTR